LASTLALVVPTLLSVFGGASVMRLSSATPSSIARARADRGRLRPRRLLRGVSLR